MLNKCALSQNQQAFREFIRHSFCIFRTNLTARFKLEKKDGSQGDVKQKNMTLIRSAPNIYSDPPLKTVSTFTTTAEDEANILLRYAAIC